MTRSLFSLFHHLVNQLARSKWNKFYCTLPLRWKWEKSCENIFIFHQKSSGKSHETRISIATTKTRRNNEALQQVGKECLDKLKHHHWRWGRTQRKRLIPILYFVSLSRAADNKANRETTWHFEMKQFTQINGCVYAVDVATVDYRKWRTLDPNELIATQRIPHASWLAFSIRWPFLSRAFHLPLHCYLSTLSSSPPAPHYSMSRLILMLETLSHICKRLLEYLEKYVNHRLTENPHFSFDCIISDLTLLKLIDTYGRINWI